MYLPELKYPLGFRLLGRIACLGLIALGWTIPLSATDGETDQHQGASR